MNNNTQDEGIETSVDINWISSLKKKVLDTKFKDRDTEPTIFRVPDILKSVDPQAYEPSIVSLGPYHRDKPHLQAMNEVKWKCLKHVLEQRPGMTLEDYVDRIRNMETRARDAYSEEVKMDSNSFVGMMLLDGCFLMLTIMWKNDWLVSDQWTLSVVVRDLFMLENQLPFFLLETLYEEFAFPSDPSFRNLTFQFIRSLFSKRLQLPSDNTETCHHIIHLFHSCIDPTTNHGNGNGKYQSSTFGFLCNSISKLLKTVSLPSNLSSSLLSLVNKKRTVRDANPEEDEDLHGNIGIGNGNQSSTFGFLCNSKLVKPVFVSLPSKLSSSLSSLVKKIRIGKVANPEEKLHDSPWIPSATVCNEAGIHFVRKKRGKNFLDITFQNGKLEIPQLRIEDTTNPLLRNLIAYEQRSTAHSIKLYVTSYTVFMDSLINTAADVELLQQQEIIFNDLGDTQEIATLFNKLGANVCYNSNDFYLKDVFNAMTKHRNTRCNKWRARLNRDYFSNPWAAISFFGALVLFVLTMTQTAFAIVSYFLPPN